jgi:hypothetical protein
VDFLKGERLKRELGIKEGSGMPTKGVHCVFMGNPPWVLGNILQ